MWLSVRPADIGFVDRARHRFTYDYRVAASATEVFEAVSDPEAFARWFPDLRAARWLTVAPHGAGSVREVALKLIAVRERVLAYEPGRRFAFTITGANRPLLAKMVEDFRLTARDDGTTRVQWTVAYRPLLWARPIAPLVRPIFGRLFERATERLIAHHAG
ncbi:MAG: hypothetical protein CSA66_02740 [Proteobacteria bacterium]|nr:MAG: hypothetical protein CSA66_02740 [Pseudomonadota bacterium]